MEIHYPKIFLENRLVLQQDHISILCKIPQASQVIDCLGSYPTILISSFHSLDPSMIFIIHPHIYNILSSDFFFIPIPHVVFSFSAIIEIICSYLGSLCKATGYCLNILHLKNNSGVEQEAASVLYWSVKSTLASGLKLLGIRPLPIV
eukprot:Sdes_comp18669_c0_seq3m8911